MSFIHLLHRFCPIIMSNKTTKKLLYILIHFHITIFKFAHHSLVQIKYQKRQEQPTLNRQTWAPPWKML